jgi:hypothetical protein
MVPSVHVTVGVPLTDASVTEVDAPSAVVGAVWLISVTVSLDIDCVAAADKVADVLLATAVIVVPEAMPKPETKSPTCPAAKLPPGPVNVTDPPVIDADAT